MSSHLKEYGIINSFQDLFKAVKKNPLTFTLSVIASYVIGIIIIIITLASLVALLAAGFGFSGFSGTNILLSVFVGIVIYSLGLAFVYGFTTSCIAFSLSGNKNNLRTTLKKALIVVPRVVATNSLVLVVIYAPIIILGLISLGSLFNRSLGTSSSNPFFVVVPLLLFPAIIWMIIASIRYALAPFVAIFEPDVSVKNTLERSRELLKNGGNLFVIKGALLVLAFIIVLSLTTGGSSYKELEDSDNLFVNLLLIVATIVVEGILVMLYFKASNNKGEKKVASLKWSNAAIFFVGIIAIILIGTFAIKSLSKEDNSALTDAIRENYSDKKGFGYDTDRKNSINVMQGSIERFYDKNGYYPSDANIADQAWIIGNLSDKYYNEEIPLKNIIIADPSGRFINTTGSEYHYVATPEGCEKCASYELISKLGSGEEYKRASAYNAINPVKQ